MKIAKLNSNNITTIEDVKKIFEALGLVLGVEYAENNGMEHLLGEEVVVKEGE